MRRPTLALLVALTAAGCATQPGPPAPPVSRGAAADGFTERPAREDAASQGGSKAAPYVLIGVAVGVGPLALALSDSATMPDTSYPE